jgi:hypothetical protein
VLVMGDEHKPGTRIRPHDEQALEEIRKLFARYRRLAREDAAMQREERSESRAKAFATRVRDSRDAPVR